MSTMQNLIEAEWDSLYSVEGYEMRDYLKGEGMELTNEGYRQLWTGFWGVTNDPIMRESK